MAPDIARNTVKEVLRMNSACEVQPGNQWQLLTWYDICARDAAFCLTANEQSPGLKCTGGLLDKLPDCDSIVRRVAKTC